MAEKQSWKSCKYHLGDLEIDMDSIAKTNLKVRLARVVNPETEKDKILKKEGINQWYYCTHPEIIRLNIYLRDGMPKENEEYTKVAQLFHLDISDNSDLDLFGRDRHHLEWDILYGLRMCAHCKFYEKD